MTQANRPLSIFTLVLIILLVGLHYAVAARGHIWYHDNALYKVNGVDYGQRDFNQYAAYIIIIATAIFFLGLFLLIDTFKTIFSLRTRIILLAFTFTFEWSLAVIASLLASTSSNQIDSLKNFYGRSQDDLDSYYRVSVADAVITFVLEITLLGILFLLTAKQLGEYRPEDEGVPPPPVTADRM